MGVNNPFRAPVDAAPRAKVLVYGPSGVGKTWFALTAPGPIAVIDTEGGTAFYAGRVGEGGLSPFDVLPTKTFAQVEQAVAYLREHPGAYQTLVIDPVTVLYEVLQDAAQERRAEVRRNAEADLEMLDWQRIKRAWKRLMNEIANLPMHVVVTARQGELKEERTGPNGRKESVKVGLRPEAEKSTDYLFDVVVRMEPNRSGGRDAVMEKDRMGIHPLNARVPSPTFTSLFAKALAGRGTAERAVPSDAHAARVDAATTMSAEEMADRDEVTTPVARITRRGAIARGDGLRSDLSARLQPDGYIIGFRLEVGDGKAVPQVIATGALGAELYLAAGGDASSLNGAQVEVTGELLEVQPPGRRKYHRLVAERIVGPGWEVPAPPSPEGDLPTTEPTSEAARTEQEELDALVW